jgi:hypothetical protein
VSGISGKVIGAGTTGFSAEFRIEGLEETLAALCALDRDIYAGLIRALKTVGDLLAADADAAAPLGAKGGYFTRMSVRGQKVGVKVGARAGSVAGRNAAIFEFAGTRMQSRLGGPITGQGAAMVSWLDGFGKPGRFLWASWDKSKDRAEVQIRTMMSQAERICRERLNAAGEAF